MSNFWGAVQPRFRVSDDLFPSTELFFLNRFRFFREETAQFLHGFGFDLADALGRHAVFGCQLVQGQSAIVLQPAAFYDAAAAVVQLSQCEMVKEMLEKAAPRLTDKGTMLHSDQGVLYRTAGYRELLAEHSMVQSMSRKANCWDNAPMESFFAVLKTECFYNAGELTVDELMKQIDDYMNYYNRERCSLKLKKLSPVAYRTQLAQSA